MKDGRERLEYFKVLCRAVSSLAILVALFYTLVATVFAGDDRHRRGTRRVFSSAAVATPDAGSFDALPASARMAVAIGGQSNAIGDQNDGGSTGTDADDLRISDAGITALTEVITGGSNETPASAAAQFLRQADASRRPVIVGNWAIGATAFAGFVQGTAAYNRSLDWMNTAGPAYITANRPSETYCTIADGWIHGETDEVAGMSAATYAATLNDFQADRNADLTNKCIGHVPLFGAPHSACTECSTQVPTAETSIAIELASQTNPRVCPFAPQYALNYIANNQHLTHQSARRLGRYLGRAIDRYVIDQAGCIGLRPRTINCVNNVCTVCMQGGDGSNLVIDTTLVAEKGDFYGFEYSDSQSDIPAISSVAIAADQRCVDITLTRNAQCPATVAAADYGVIAVDPGAAQQQSHGTNIRDGDTTASGDGDAALHNWLVPFRRSVDSCSGSASSAQAFSNTHSVDSTGAATNMISARTLTALNGRSDGTIEFLIRSNAATWPTSSNVVLSFAASGQRQFTIQHSGAAGGLRFFLSTGLSDASNWCDTTGWVGQTPYHVVWVPTTGTVYRNGTSITCTVTGSVPGTFTSPTRSTWTILGTTGGSSNNNMSHLAVYQRNLSAADVTERYNGGTPIDARLLSTGGPCHYWQFQQTWEDVGSCATRNLTPYGSGVTFEALALDP